MKKDNRTKQNKVRIFGTDAFVMRKHVALLHTLTGSFQTATKDEKQMLENIAWR